MATDGPNPTPCHPKIFKKGVHIFTTHSIPSNAMERWVQNIAQEADVPVDWYTLFAAILLFVIALILLHAIKVIIRVDEERKIRRQKEEPKEIIDSKKKQITELKEEITHVKDVVKDEEEKAKPKVK